MLNLFDVIFIRGKYAVVIISEDNNTVVRDGLTKGQANTLAVRLNNEATDSSLKSTRREQKFEVHVELNFECQTFQDQEDFYTAFKVKQEVLEALDVDFVDMITTKPKYQVTVKKLYDKQVPNV